MLYSLRYFNTDTYSALSALFFYVALAYIQLIICAYVRAFLTKIFLKQMLYMQAFQEKLYEQLYSL